ncbi:MAG: CPBP family intramembrane metalloprotease [Anaerolineales bacterium]|nr:CPBP family intramembrane metalloprotease [Anaerolineales bacterium]
MRSGWRVALYVVTARLVQILAAIIFGIVSTAILFVVRSDQLATPEQVSQLVAELSNVATFSPFAFGFRVTDTLVILGIVLVFRRVLDRRSFRSLGFDFSRDWWREIFAGFALILIAWSAIFLAAILSGAATIIGFAWDEKNWLTILGALANGLIFNLLVALAEETDSRGYILQNLAEGIRIVPAILVSSAYFGALHLLNPGAGIASTLGIFFAGVLLALGYYATRRLWFSIGMHAAWNFAEGSLFGFPVSGLDMGGIFRLRITGPDWLTGGAFGPEAGALAIVMEIALIAILFAWTRRRKNHAE